MRLVVDMNLSPSWAAYLGGAGHDAVHWSAIGAGDTPDHVLMQWAADEGRVVMTSDLDFSAILAATGRTGPSVLQIRSDLLTPAALGALVLATLSRLLAELEAGAIVTVDAYRARLRVLPLRDAPDAET
jgi:predicted nuclease of predicted toxin-antitoxin system